MTADCLIDTSILVYAIDATLGNEGKRKKALELIETADFGLSAQVLQEFYATVTRKISKPLAPAAALQLLEKYRSFPLISVDHGLVLEGVLNSQRFQVSYWDGAILAAAGRLHAGIVYSEDLSHGQTYGQVTVVNPFQC